MNTRALAKRIDDIERRTGTTSYICLEAYPGLTESEVNRLWFGPDTATWPGPRVTVVMMINSPDLVCHHDDDFPGIPYDFAERRHGLHFAIWWREVVSKYDARREEVERSYGLPLHAFTREMAAKGMLPMVASVFTDPQREAAVQNTPSVNVITSAGAASNG